MNRAVNARQEVVDAIHAEVFADRISRRAQTSPEVTASTIGLSPSDSELLNRACNAKNGPAFIVLYYNGDISAYRTADNEGRSEAELALSSKLRFWCGNNPERIERLLRGSALMRGKLNRDDYVKRTIDVALASSGPTYSGGRGMGNRNNGATNGATNGAAPPVQNKEVWPEPVESAAFYGPAGDFARASEPYYEGESVALLIQFLLVFGNLVGRNLVFMHLKTAHYINLFAVIVGSTAAAAKGTGWNLVRTFFEYVDGLLNERIHGGLSSGEGLIHCVRDRKSEEQKRGSGNKRRTEVVVVDPGVTDKRVVIFETEFSSTLRVIARPENIVSEIIRGAFDGQHILQTLVNNNPERATDAHISVIGHITPRELRELLTETSMANGFGNRFPLFLVRGTKRIPIPDTTDLDTLNAVSQAVTTQSNCWGIVRKVPNHSRLKRLPPRATGSCKYWH